MAKTEMTQRERLQALVNQPNQNSNMTAFRGLVVVNVGCKPTEYYPKITDKNGKKVTDLEGRIQRAEHSDGYTYTFSQFGTAKMVKLVLPKKLDLGLLEPYRVSGLGYDIRNANIVYLEKDITISKY